MNVNYLERVPAALPLSGGVVWLDLFYTNCFFKPQLFFFFFFFLSPRADESAHSPFVLSLPIAAHSVGRRGSLPYGVWFLCLSFHFLCGLSVFCGIEAIQAALSSLEEVLYN